MWRFSIALVVGLAVAACIMPLAAASACEDSHSDVCESGCSCVCHTETAFGHDETLAIAVAQIVHGAVSSECRSLGLLLVPDIFRPPVSA